MVTKFGGVLRTCRHQFESPYLSTNSLLQQLGGWQTTLLHELVEVVGKVDLHARHTPKYTPIKTLRQITSAWRYFHREMRAAIRDPGIRPPNFEFSGEVARRRLEKGTIEKRVVFASRPGRSGQYSMIPRPPPLPGCCRVPSEPLDLASCDQ